MTRTSTRWKLYLNHTFKAVKDMSRGRCLGLKMKRESLTDREKKKAARQFAPKRGDRKAAKMLRDERDRKSLDQLRNY